MLYIIGRGIFFLLCKLIFGYKIYGRYNVPKTGAVIIASNHASYLDPIFIGIGTSRILSFMARESLFRNLFFAKIIGMVNTFPVKRDYQDVGAMREAIARLKQKKALLLFPEGARTKDGNLQRAKAGISLLAYMASATVVPAYVKGSYEVLPKGARFVKCAPVSVYFGRTLDFDKFFKASRYNRPAEAYAPFADYIMEHIAKLKEMTNDKAQNSK